MQKPPGRGLLLGTGGCRNSDKAIRVSLDLLAPAPKLAAFLGRLPTV